MSTENISAEVSALRNQVFILLVALIVCSSTLTIFLFRQASMANKDLEQLKPQATQVINGFNQNQPLVVNFINQLVAYGQAHPDFRPVLAKYGIAPVAGVPAAAPKK